MNTVPHKICAFALIMASLIFVTSCQKQSLKKILYRDKWGWKQELYENSDGCLYGFSEDKNELYLWSMAGYNGSTYVVPDEIDGVKVTVFLEDAVINCNNIETLIITDSVRCIDFDLYYEFSSLKTIFIGAGAQRIMKGIFFNCPNLEQVTVDIQNPYYYSENNCILTKDSNCLISISNGMQSIPDSAIIIGGDSFLRSNYKYIEIPKSILKIEELSFQQSKDLTAVFIPNSVTEIGPRIITGVIDNTDDRFDFFCESTEKPDGWDNNWYYAFSKGYNDEHDDNYYKELNDECVTIHWGATIEDYYDFINSTES